MFVLLGEGERSRLGEPIGNWRGLIFPIVTVFYFKSVINLRQTHRA